jgi:hypothetical protein
MMKQHYFLLAGVIIIALALVAPVSAAYSIAITAGDRQSATVGTAVAIPPSVKIMDGIKPAIDVRVTFAVAGGRGTITGANATTNASGIATVGSWKLGTIPGTNTLTATNGSLTATFTATGTAGAATQMVKYGGDGQSATVGTAVAIPPSVKIMDVYNNTVKGKAILFTISLGGGSVLPGTAVTTGTNGIATATSWTLGPTAGINSLIATSSSLTPVTFTATAIPSIPAPNISGISPTSAVNSGQQTIDITGTGFNGSTVSLTKTGQSAIAGVRVGTDTPTHLSRTFTLNGVVSGTWNLTVLNSDGRNATGSFTIRNATVATVIAISPTTWTVNTTVSTIITGTGFTPATAKIRLYRSGNYISGAVNTGGTSTRLTGSFNLNQATPGVYDVCVLPDGTEASKICGPTFTINADYGSITVISAPPSGSVYLNGIFKGYTPITLERITPGTYLVMVQNTGYFDWSDSVTVTSGHVSTVNAPLVQIEIPPSKETVPTITKPTSDVTTTLPSPTPTTKASPVDPALFLVTACLAFIILRKH